MSRVWAADWCCRRIWNKKKGGTGWRRRPAHTNESHLGSFFSTLSAQQCALITTEKRKERDYGDTMCLYTGEIKFSYSNDSSRQNKGEKRARQTLSLLVWYAFFFPRFEQRERIFCISFFFPLSSSSNPIRTRVVRAHSGAAPFFYLFFLIRRSGQFIPIRFYFFIFENLVPWSVICAHIMMNIFQSISNDSFLFISFHFLANGNNVKVTSHRRDPHV